jgi:hypothetical protein
MMDCGIGFGPVCKITACAEAGDEEEIERLLVL